MPSLGSDLIGMAGEAALLAGFLGIWLGFACLTVPVLVRVFFTAEWWHSLSLPWRDRITYATKVMNEVFTQSSKAGCGRAGQVLLALGSGIWIVAGLVWLILKIVQKAAG